VNVPRSAASMEKGTVGATPPRSPEDKGGSIRDTPADRLRFKIPTRFLGDLPVGAEEFGPFDGIPISLNGVAARGDLAAKMGLLFRGVVRGDEVVRMNLAGLIEDGETERPSLPFARFGENLADMTGSTFSVSSSSKIVGGALRLPGEVRAGRCQT
jgi:hypothetical protein